MSLLPLPIDALLPQVIESLRTSPSVVLEAPPGSGKTTRVPWALYESGLLKGKEVLILQPRRLATRLAANRIAFEHHEKPGRTVGYQIRFDDVSSAQTKIRFLTEGILTRRMMTDRTLANVGAVILDEFHERHLATDLSLGMLKRLQQNQRPDLKLMVMSATLDAAPIAAFLDGCPVLRSEGRRFDVEIEYLTQEDPRPVDQQVLGALKRLVTAELDGDVLVFLPGASEIRRCLDLCRDFSLRHQLELLPLHGEIPAAEQDKVLAITQHRKVIFSTNVAETSVTLPNVAAVIDAGLARVAFHSPWTGVPTLKLAKVSKSSAIQRAGRAGRTRLGRCLRLYTKGDFDQRPASDAPEIRRSELTEAVLALRASGVDNLKSFQFFESPPAAALEAADKLLHQLGAVSESGQLTPIGTELVRLPTHPRLARILLEAHRLGHSEEGATAAALLSERDIRAETRASFGKSSHAQRATSGSSDLTELMDRFSEGLDRGPKSAGLDPSAFQSVERVRKQLLRVLPKHASAVGQNQSSEVALEKALLTGFPDRVAKRRKAGNPEIIFAQGGSASVDDTSCVRDAQWMIAIDAEERKGTVFVRLASQIEPDWLLDTLTDQIVTFDDCEWNATMSRVEQVSRMSFGALTLVETRTPSPPSPQAASLLVQHAMKAGLEQFVDLEAFGTLRERLALLRTYFPDASFPDFEEQHLLESLATICADVTSFKELKEINIAEQLLNSLTSEQRRLLQTQTPEKLSLPNGKSLQVSYQPHKPPWVESRLQDFFGMLKTPAVCQGRVPLVIHLLAPNKQAVQVTSDLSGFWERHYPAVRKELMRHYPRHHWPENPKTAEAPPPRKLRPV